MSDTPTLVRFYSGWERDGNGPDGLPAFRQVLRIRLDRPPFLSVEREAGDNDMLNHPEPYALYQRTEAARIDVHGYPLALWPACLPYLFQMCAARDIHTVEQLAQLVSKKRRSEAVRAVPSEVIELADRAVKMIELQAKSGQYEELITDLQNQVEVLKEQVTEAVTTISTQKTMIETLKLKAVA